MNHEEAQRARARGARLILVRTERALFAAGIAPISHLTHAAVAISDARGAVSQTRSVTSRPLALKDVGDDVRAIFVSPHLDDVALSCGASVAMGAARGESPIVVTVMTAKPGPQSFGEAAKGLHVTCGFDEDDGDGLFEVRREEDLAATEILGARSLWLPYLDAVYRGYETMEEVFGASPPEPRLVAKVAHDVEVIWQRTGRRRASRAVVYLPLGLGNHVDHRLCASIGVRLRGCGATVLHYEDFPYVSTVDDAERKLDDRIGALDFTHLRGREGSYLERRLHAIGLTPRAVEITPFLEKRIEAILAYRSQVRQVLGSETPRAYVERHARRVAVGRGPAERFWTYAARASARGAE
jgi:LmbE family N-acetylglucosaminyl deacetylase